MAEDDGAPRLGKARQVGFFRIAALTMAMAAGIALPPASMAKCPQPVPHPPVFLPPSAFASPSPAACVPSGIALGSLDLGDGVTTGYYQSQLAGLPTCAGPPNCMPATNFAYNPNRGWDPARYAAYNQMRLVAAILGRQLGQDVIYNYWLSLPNDVVKLTFMAYSLVGHVNLNELRIRDNYFGAGLSAFRSLGIWINSDEGAAMRIFYDDTTGDYYVPTPGVQGGGILHTSAPWICP